MKLKTSSWIDPKRDFYGGTFSQVVTLKMIDIRSIKSLYLVGTLNNSLFRNVFLYIPLNWPITFVYKEGC